MTSSSPFPPTTSPPALNATLWEAITPRQTKAWPTRLQGETTCDLCIIGAGGAGLAAATAAREQGLDVVLLEKDVPGAGAAGRNGGFLLAGLALFYHDARQIWGDFAALLYQATLDELDRCRATTPSIYRSTGSLRIGKGPEEEEDCRAQLAALTKDGFEAMSYVGHEGRGILIPDDAACNPLARCQEMARYAIAQGLRLYCHCPATNIGAHRVETAHGSVVASHVLVATDEWHADDEGRGTRPIRLQMLATAPLSPLFSRPVYTRYGYDYYQQLPTGELALGGGRDLTPDESETQEMGTSADVQAYLDELLVALAPQAKVTHRWSGSVSYDRQQLPYAQWENSGIGRIGAYNGHGNLLSTLLGREMIHQLAGGSTPSLDALAQARTYEGRPVAPHA